MFYSIFIAKSASFLTYIKKVPALVTYL